MLNVKTFSNEVSLKEEVTSKKKAFSLIELSIVLIIIGLLVAGVTGGASLIKSAELRSVMGEARGYNVAVNSFFVQFDALPGDFDQQIGGATVVGDNNDKIEFVNSVSPGSLEGITAWVYLSEAGMIDTTVDAMQTNDYTLANSEETGVIATGEQLPSSRIKNGGWVFDYLATEDDASNTDLEHNVVILTNDLETFTNSIETPTSIAQNAVPTGVIVPADALSIDSKMDDGIPNAGEVRAVQNLEASEVADAADACYTKSALNTGSYNSVNPDKECALTFHVDVLN